jgi:hypothetical protein
LEIEFIRIADIYLYSVSLYHIVFRLLILFLLAKTTDFSVLYNCLCPITVTMRMKPIPLAAYSKDFVPPVTGVGGRPSPVANSFDATGNFAGRARMGSLSKKRRLDELDRVFDLSAPYPPVTFPGKPQLDLGEIKNLLVAATAAGEEVGPILASQDLDPKIKAFGSLSLALLNVVSAIVENGLMPLTDPPASTGTATAETHAKKIGPAPPPKTAAGFRELMECLEKADTESILFDANLGNVSMGNRNGLNTAFSNGIRTAVIATAEAKGHDPSEAVRAMNDALDCVSELDFIGVRSEKAKGKDPVTQAEREHFTMPVKLKFEDRNTRLHFERTVKAQCGLRAVMSLPKNIRTEQSLFVRALRARYPEDFVTARPDVGSLHFIGFRKKPTEKRWVKCSESIPIPVGIMLPEYKPRTAVILPPAIQVGVEVPVPDLEPMSQDQSQPESESQSS